MIKKDNAIHSSIETIIEQLLLEVQFEYADYKIIDEILDKNSKINDYISKFDEDKNERAKTLTLLLMRNWISKTHRHSAFEEFKDVNDAYLIQLVFLLSISNSYNIKSIQINDDKQIIRTIIKITNKVLERTNDSELRALLQDILHAYNNAIKEVSAADTTREDVLTYGHDYISFQSEHYIIYICVTVRSIRDLGIPGVWCVSSGTMTKMIGHQQYYAGADGRIFVIIRDKNRKSEKYGLVYDINNNNVVTAYDKEDYEVEDLSMFNEVVNVLEKHTDELHALEQRKEYKELTKEDQEYINTNIYAPNAYELFQQRFNNVYAVDLYVVRNDIDVTKIQDQRLLSLPYIKTKYYIKTKQFDKISIASTDDVYTLLIIYDFSDYEFNKKIWSSEKAVRTIVEVFGLKLSAIHAVDGLYYIDVDGNVSFYGIRRWYNFPLLFNKINGTFDCSKMVNLVSLKGGPKYVEGDFNCYENQNLTSLEGAPEYVGGDFSCYHNPKLVSLEGAPRHVGGSFYCYENPNLTSLRGAPDRVDRSFECYECNLTSLEGTPEYVGGDFDCSYNDLEVISNLPKYIGGGFWCSECNLTSLRGVPEHINGKFICSNNPLISLADAPKRVEGNFDCSECNLTSLEGAPEYVGSNFDCRDNRNLHPSWIEWLKQHSEIKGKIIYTNIGNENSPNPAPGFTHDTINNDVTDVVEQVVMRILNKEGNYDD